MTRAIAIVAVAVAGLALAACGSSQPMSASAPPPSVSASAGANISAGGSPLPQGALSSAVTKAAVDFGTYDYRTIQQSGWAFLKDLTASYKNAYAGPADQYVASVVDGKSTATAKVLSSGVISQSATQAVVIVTIQQALNNATSSTFKLQMTLLKQTDGSWLVDEATPANGGAQ